MPLQPVHLLRKTNSDLICTCPVPARNVAVVGDVKRQFFAETAQVDTNLLASEMFDDVIDP